MTTKIANYPLVCPQEQVTRKLLFFSVCPPILFRKFPSLLRNNTMSISKLLSTFPSSLCLQLKGLTTASWHRLTSQKTWLINAILGGWNLTGVILLAKLLIWPAARSLACVFVHSVKYLWRKHSLLQWLIHLFFIYFKIVGKIFGVRGS